MDLPATQMTSTMLNEPLEKYKALYSKYVKELVNVHNYHNTFINNLGYDSGLQIRNSLRMMAKLEMEMRVLCRKAYVVHKNQMTPIRKVKVSGFIASGKRGPGKKKIKKDVDVPE
jgi:hypothetical protein